MRYLLLAFVFVLGCRNVDEAPLSSDGGTADLAKTSNNGSNDLATSNPNPNPSPTPNPNPAACGTCPSGTTCGSANGLAVCRAASGIPLFQHVFVIVMENTSLSSLQKSTTTPFLQGLFGTAAYASDYHGVTHPSLPNYIALTSGSPGVQMDGTTAVACDCDPVGATCNSCSTISTLFSSCGCVQEAQNLADQIEAAPGLTWRDYGEDMGSACNTSGSGAYAPRHVPFLYYDNIQSDVTRCQQHVVDFSNFDGDLMNAPPSLAFIAPNLNDDMHGTGLTQSGTDVTNGDTWLMKHVGAITSSAAYQQGGILFIVWDEDDLSGTLAKDDPIPMFVLSPYAKSGGYASPVKADHYALLATIEDGLNLGRLGSAAQATPLADFFPAQ